RRSPRPPSCFDPGGCRLGGRHIRFLQRTVGFRPRHEIADVWTVSAGIVVRELLARSTASSQAVASTGSAVASRKTRVAPGVPERCYRTGDLLQDRFAVLPNSLIAARSKYHDCVDASPTTLRAWFHFTVTVAIILG